MSKKPKYLSLTRTAKAHGTTVQKIKNVLHMRGYLDKGEPTHKSISKDLIRIRPALPDSRFYNPEKPFYLAINQTQVARILRYAGESRDPRFRCTSPYEAADRLEQMGIELALSLGMSKRLKYPARKAAAFLFDILGEPALHLSNDLEQGSMKSSFLAMHHTHWPAYVKANFETVFAAIEANGIRSRKHFDNAREILNGVNRMLERRNHLQ